MANPADEWSSADLKGVATGGLIREEVMAKIWDISAVPLNFTDMVADEAGGAYVALERKIGSRDTQFGHQVRVNNDTTYEGAFCVDRKQILLLHHFPAGRDRERVSCLRGVFHPSPLRR